MTLTKQEAAFLEGLAELSEKTGVGIAGCGCCGSPHLFELDAKWRTADRNKIARPVRYMSEDGDEVAAESVEDRAKSQRKQ